MTRSLPSASPDSETARQLAGLASSAETLGPMRAQLARSTLRDSRLRKHADYQAAYKVGRKQFASLMSWFLADRLLIPARPVHLPPLPPGPRVGLTVPKVLGKAHDRNRIKRRMREAVRSHLHELPEGIDLILHPKRTVLAVDFGKLQDEIMRIFRQAASQTRQTRQVNQVRQANQARLSETVAAPDIANARQRPELA